MNKKVFVLLIAALLFAACADLFQDKVSMDSGDSASLGDLFNDTGNVEIPLEAPKQVYVDSAQDSRSIKLSWLAGAGAASYQIERALIKPGADGNYREPGEADWAMLASPVYGLLYTDNILREASEAAPEYGYRYYYRIFSENQGKSSGTVSAAASAPVYGYLLGAPKNVWADRGKSESEIWVYWDPVRGASSYEIYRAASVDGVYSLIGTSYGNPYRYKNSASIVKGNEYYYSVAAISASGGRSAPGGRALGFARAAGAPSAPVLGYSDNGKGEKNGPITITVSGAASYDIYRYTQADAALKKLSPESHATGGTFTDPEPVPGVYNYYQAQAIDSQKSAFSSPLEAFVLSPPLAAEASRIRNDGGTPETSDDKADTTLSFRPAINTRPPANTYNYRIYSGADYLSPDTLTLVDTLSNPEPGDESGFLSYTIQNESSPALFYRVTTVNTANGEESAYSAVISPPLSLPVQNLKTTKAGFYEGAVFADELLDESANSLGVYPTKISWEKPATESPAYYYVYRALSKNGLYRRLNREPVHAGEGPLFSCLDSDDTIPAGAYCYYKVLAQNYEGEGSIYSEAKAGYGALTPERYFLEYNKTILFSQSKLTLMHADSPFDKIGQETIYGELSGSLYFNAVRVGMAAEVEMLYTDYSDFNIDDADTSLGPYFLLNGNTDTTSGLTSGNMHGTVTITGMYPGKIWYEKVGISFSKPGSGWYGVKREGFENMDDPSEASWKQVSYTLGN
jgi:hypothetical protein